MCCVIKSYDEAQASTLTNEIKRFKAELELAIHADEVLHQVIDAMVFESRLRSENAGLNLAQIGGTSAGNLSSMESVQSIAQKTLRERQRYQSLRKDLDTFYHHQEADMAAVVDLIQVCSPHFHLYRVEAIPCNNCPKCCPSISIAEWMNIFLSQPWLEQQCIREA